MLVGMTPPTSGTATMPGGMKITENMPAIRKCLGVCPQHDILFAELTALQHLQVSLLYPFELLGLVISL
jgi:ATP-binding cassette subfamily A (ABC1) protein 3